MTTDDEMKTKWTKIRESISKIDALMLRLTLLANLPPATEPPPKP